MFNQYTFPQKDLTCQRKKNNCRIQFTTDFDPVTYVSYFPGKQNKIYQTTVCRFLCGKIWKVINICRIFPTKIKENCKICHLIKSTTSQIEDVSILGGWPEIMFSLFIRFMITFLYDFVPFVFFRIFLLSWFRKRIFVAPNGKKNARKIYVFLLRENPLAALVSAVFPSSVEMSLLYL